MLNKSSEASVAKKEHGKVYWFFFHIRHRGGMFAKLHGRSLILSLLSFVGVSFLLRAGIHQYVIIARTHMVMFVVPIVATWVLFWFLRRHSNWKIKTVFVVTYIAFGMMTFLWGEVAHRYVSLYWRYKTLNIVELTELPETDHERIHPLNSIYSLAHEAVSSSESLTLPYVARVGKEYEWIIAIEPTSLSRITQGVTELIKIPIMATTPNLYFGKDRRVSVNFLTGDNLLLSRNSRTATIKKFGLWRYLNYEPGDVMHVPDDSGKMVQVVALIRWKGFFFPRAEFGGIQLIRQEGPSFLGELRLMLFGAGTWIAPRDIPKHPFLVGQNLLSQKVSRYIAESFRFQEGFLAPMPGYHFNDIRIPDLPADVNNEPFTTFFKGNQAGMPGILYHYFALEPYDRDKQVLFASVLVPADGTPKVFVDRHYKRGESLIGVSTVGPKIIGSKKINEWTRNHPAEHRPWVRYIAGRKRVFFLTTVVTSKEEKGKFTAGSIPDVVLTDAKYGEPVWVDPMKSDMWTEEVTKHLGSMWSANEK